MKPVRSIKSQAAFIITAAGTGTRMGTGEKKEFRRINGASVLGINLETVLDAGIFCCGVITCTPGTQDRTRDILSHLKQKLKSLGIPLFFCDGGAERQQSVFAGLKCLAENRPGLLKSGVVLIHDGARPWASPELFLDVALGSERHGGCAPVTHSVDALKIVTEEGFISGHLDRKEVYCVQTPQGFIFEKILHAHEKAASDGNRYIDDTEIYSRYGGRVYTVAGERTNIKITYPDDIPSENQELVV